MGKEWDKFRTDDPGTARHRGERAGTHGELKPENTTNPAAGKVAYGGGKRPSTYRCTGCGKRDQFRNAHDCEPSAEWRRELIDPHAAPPTMLAFQEWCRCWALEAYRVLKPGGHLFAFGGTRTYHRLTCGLEDAGFEVRDSVLWLYGTGFPKSLNVSKAIDAAAGAEREVVGVERTPFKVDKAEADRVAYGAYDAGIGEDGYRVNPITEAATEAAKQWEGWGSALKPAHEPIAVGRKPLRTSIIASVQEHGTGALNIAAGSIPVPEGQEVTAGISDPANRAGVVGEVLLSPKPMEGESEDERRERFQAAQRASLERTNTEGRWPANVAMSHGPGCHLVGVHRVRGSGQHEAHHQRSTPGGNEVTHGAMAGVTGADHVGEDGLEAVERWECAPGCPIAELDRQSGPAGAANPASGPTHEGARHSGSMSGPMNGMGDRAPSFHTDSGGASRFFYCTKASAAERNAGLHRRKGTASLRDGGRFHSGGRTEVDGEWAETGSEQPKENQHPTVKPIELMRWLIRLATPPGGTVLDPFLGSGTTGCAAALEGFDFIGIEQDSDFAQLARDRIEWWKSVPSGTPVASALVSAARQREIDQSGQLGLLGGDDGDSE